MGERDIRCFWTPCVARRVRCPNVSGAEQGLLREVSGRAPVLGLAPFTWEQGLAIFSLEAGR